MQSKQNVITDENIIDEGDILETASTVEALTDEAPMTEAEKPFTIDQEKVAAKIAADTALAKSLAERQPLPATGDPNARISDPYTVNVTPRYNIVQNQSDKLLVIPDMKTNDEDMGLVFQPGEVVVLTEFYSPQQINRSKGLRYAATDVHALNGVNGRPMLIPLNTEEEGKSFAVPKKVQMPKGSMFEDQLHNDFDDRFAELELRDAKREEKLRKKTLASRKLKQHGAAPSHV